MVLPEDPEVGPEKALLAFRPLSENEPLKLVRQSAKKSCPLDPAPTSLVVSCLDVLLPVITRIINCSLTSGEFPDCWEEALVSPLLKKSGVLSEFTNLRPVSNLQYVLKLTERAFFDQTHAHLTSHGSYPPFQSAYRKCHSTETTLLKVQNDVRMNLDSSTCYPFCVTRFKCCVWHSWPWSVIRGFQNRRCGGSETRLEVAFPVSEEERMRVAFSPPLENAAWRDLASSGKREYLALLLKAKHYY